MITVGMFIIIWYGVLKILINIIWKFLFGKPLIWEVGLLEMLFKKLRPVYVQRVADMTDKELEETTDIYVNKLHKLRQKLFNNKQGGVARMEKLKGLAKIVLRKVWANKKTNAAIATVGAIAITGAAYLAHARLGFNPLGLSQHDFVKLLTVEAIAAVGLVLPGVLGAGYQTVEQYEKMSVAKKRVKAAKKQAKIEGNVVTPAKEAEKLAKKLGIAIEAALPIVQEQVRAKQAAAVKKKQAGEKLAIEKLAKKLFISEDQARIIRAEQLKNIKK